jgi:hypothetical protein
VRRRLAARGALAVMGVAWLTEVLKLIAAEPRPEFFQPGIALVVATGFALPSGHAALSAARWGFLATLRRRRWATLTAVILAFGVGLSRVYLGVHFPTDVLAGWLIGAMGLLLVTKLGPAVERHVANHARAVNIGAALVIPPLLLLCGIGPQTLTILAAIQGAFLGLAVSRGWLPDEPQARRVPACLVAVTLTFAVAIALKLSLGPWEEEAPWLRWLRYDGVGLTLTLLAPLLVTKLPRRLCAPS